MKLYKNGKTLELNNVLKCYQTHLLRPKNASRCTNTFTKQYQQQICTKSTEPNQSDSLTRSTLQSQGSYLVSAGLNSNFLR